MQPSRIMTLATVLAVTPAGLAPADYQVNLDLQGHQTQDNNVDEDPGFPDFIDSAADGVASIRDINHQWNYHTDGAANSTTALSDVNGNATGITFELLTASTNGFRDDSGFPNSPVDDTGRDYIFNTGNVITESRLTGLDTSGDTTYDLYVITSNVWFNGWQDIVVTHGGGVTTKSTSADAPPDTAQYLGGDLVEGRQYSVFTGLTPDGNGEIGIDIDGFEGAAGDKYYSGLQIVANVIPEPGSVSLLGLGGLLLAVRKKRP